jgi:hypothetical protein
MLIEDYSNAVYWRIAAIFSTIAALFSVVVVLWFLIFRDNPNLPDETDSIEKLRFDNNINKKKYNLISELTHAFKHFPKLSLSNNSQQSSSIGSQNFFQRLAYCLFASFGSEKNKCSSEDSG